MSGGYELHQKLRTKAVRQLKRKDYDGAITSLYDGAHKLLEMKEQGSGCDLACYMVDVYSQAEKPSTKENRDRIVDLLQLSSPNFWRKKVIDAAVKWSAAVTSTPAGDGHLRLAIADILSKDGEYYTAETHYIAACSPPPGLPSANELFPAHAPKSFASMTLDWLSAHAQEAIKQNGGKGQRDAVERVMAGSFAVRGLVPLLLARSLTSSRGFLSIFVSRLVAKHPTILLPTRPNPKSFTPPGGLTPGGEAQQLYMTASSELNFTQMMLALCSQAVDHKKRSKGRPVPDSLRDAWIGLVRQFEKESVDDSDDIDQFFFEVLPQMSQVYFDMQPPRGSGGNFMQEMLGSLMGGGGPNAGGSDSKSTNPISIRHAPPPKVPMIEAAGEASNTPSAAGAAEDELDLD